MLTRQQMNDYLIQATEKDLQDRPEMKDRLFWDFRAWVLELINAGKQQLMGKPTSEQKAAGEGEAHGGSPSANTAGEGEEQQA